MSETNDQQNEAVVDKTEKKEVHHAAPHAMPAMKKKIMIYGLIALLVIASFLLGYNLNLQKTYNKINNPQGTNNENAKIEVIVWSDFQCPYCKRGVDTLNQAMDEFGRENFDVVCRHFPLSFHQYAQKAAEASECARDQDKFWEYHDLLFENQQSLDIASLKAYADELGLDAATFNTCLDDGEKYEVVRADFDQGQAEGIQGTPNFKFTNKATGKKAELGGAMPLADFRKAIETVNS